MVITIIALLIGGVIIGYILYYAIYFICVIWGFCEEIKRIREKKKRLREALEYADSIKTAKMLPPKGVWRCEYCFSHNSQASTVCKACLQSKKSKHYIHL